MQRRFRPFASAIRKSQTVIEANSSYPGRGNMSPLFLLFAGDAPSPCETASQWRGRLLFRHHPVFRCIVRLAPQIKYSSISLNTWLLRLYLKHIPVSKFTSGATLPRRMKLKSCQSNILHLALKLIPTTPFL